MASNDNNKRKIEEAESSVVVMKRLRFSDDDRCDNSSGELEEKELEVEMEEEVSSEESSMNQLNTLKEKLMAKHGHDLFFSNDGNTSSMESEPHSPETHSSRVCSDPDNSDDDDDDFWM
jgi:hypothetical protein